MSHVERRPLGPLKCAECGYPSLSVADLHAHRHLDHGIPQCPYIETTDAGARRCMLSATHEDGHLLEDAPPMPNDTPAALPRADREIRDSEDGPTVAELREQAARVDRVLKDAAITLAFGIEGKMPREAAYNEAFVALYGFCFGPNEALRIVAEGTRDA